MGSHEHLPLKSSLGEVWTVGGGVLGGRFEVLTTFNTAKLIRMIFRSGVLNVQRIEDN